MREVRISDMTMKLVESSKTLTLSFKEKLELTKLLDRLGASVIEIEGIANERVDTLRIKSIASIVRDTVLAVPVKLDGSDVERIWECLREAKNARLQVAASVSPAQMEYIYHKKADGMLEAIDAAIKKCASVSNDIEFIAEDATRADRGYLKQAIECAVNAGAKTVTICDDAGAMLPDEFGAFVKDLIEDVPSLKYVSLGISCSDALYMADACATAAIISGVDEVKASSYPAGTVSLEKISKIIAEKADICNAHTSVRETELKRISTQIKRICETRVASSAVTYNINDADESIALTANDTLESVLECATKLGYDLSAEDQMSVFESFQRIAAKKDVIGSRELDSIIATAALQVPETYVIDKYVYNSGNVVKATAHVQIMKDEQMLESVAAGDGPVDAIFLAVENVVGRHFELDDFQIQAVTEGQEAMAETVVKLVSNGKVYSGRGISTDVVGSSIRAFVNAINKIVFEEQR